MARPFIGGEYPKELYQSPLYRVWGGMKSRCANVRVKQYADYGGRGIKVCDRWQGFANFVQDMGNDYASGMTLDRVDTNGDYSPENCRWATRQTQNNNKRNNNYIEHEGAVHTLTEWAHIKGLRPGTVRQRFYVYGWPLERCLSERILH
jgi:hypothetical protein